MDFSGFLVIAMAALIAALTVMATAAVPRWRMRRWFPIGVGSSALLGAILMQPWRALALGNWAVLPLGLGLIAVWAVIGSLIGGFPVLPAIKALKLARRRI